MQRPRGSSAYDAVEAIKAAGINFVAMDFDQTMINTHTYGGFGGTVEELALTVRPEFKELVPLIFAANIPMGIVTFSGQISLIRRAMYLVFGNIANHIVIRGGGTEENWRIPGMFDYGGKQNHMASAASELCNNHHVEISKASTLLIDDDHKNITIALNHGVRAVLFQPSRPARVFDGIVEMANASRA